MSNNNSVSTKFLDKHVDKLLAELGIPESLEACGVEEDELPEIMERLKDITILSMCDAIVASAMDSDIRKEAMERLTRDETRLRDEAALKERLRQNALKLIRTWG